VNYLTFDAGILFVINKFSFSVKYHYISAGYLNKERVNYLFLLMARAGIFYIGKKDFLFFYKSQNP